MENINGVGVMRLDGIEREMCFYMEDDKIFIILPDGLDDHLRESKDVEFKYGDKEFESFYVNKVEDVKGSFDKLASFGNFYFKEFSDNLVCYALN